MQIALSNSVIRRWSSSAFYPALTIAGLGIALLAGAYAFEYLGGLKPCALCLEQRVPWMVLIVLGGAIIAAGRANTPQGLTIVLFVIAAGVALYGAYLGGFHAGVEWKWWPGPTVCSAGGLDLGGRDGGLLGGLSSADVVRCDEIPWSLFGLSLAGYNFLFSLLAAGLALAGAGTQLKEAR